MNSNYKPQVISNEKEFGEILQSKDRFITLVYASWCPFCIRFLPVFAKYAQGKTEWYFMVKDDREIIADIYDIDVVPTVLFFENGSVSKRLDGILGTGLSERQLADFIRVCNVEKMEE